MTGLEKAAEEYVKTMDDNSLGYLIDCFKAGARWAAPPPDAALGLSLLFDIAECQGSLEYATKKDCDNVKAAGEWLQRVSA